MFFIVILFLLFSARSEFFSDPVDLQLDYWVAPSSVSNAGDSSNKKSSNSDAKNSIKTSIRYMFVQRTLHSLNSGSGSSDVSAFNMQYWTKEKKQKSKYILSQAYTVLFY